MSLVFRLAHIWNGDVPEKARRLAGLFVTVQPGDGERGAPRIRKIAEGA